MRAARNASPEFIDRFVCRLGDILRADGRTALIDRRHRRAVAKKRGEIRQPDSPGNNRMNRGVLEQKTADAFTVLN